MNKKVFVQWLKQYKEFGVEKANNVVKRLNVLSDEVFNGNISNVPLFSNEKYTNFAKWRMHICQKIEVSPVVKKDLDLYGDFLQMMELTNISYSVDETSELQLYCESMRMSYSYKPVLILSMLRQIEGDLPLSIENVVNNMIGFYQNRIQSGLIAEKDDSIFAQTPVDYLAAKAVIESNPIEALLKAGVINYDKKNERLSFKSLYLIEKEDLKGVHDACCLRLQSYFENLASNEEKGGNISANSILEMIEKIPDEKLKNDLRKAFIILCEENRIGITKSVECGANVSSDSFIIDKDDDRKIGKLVRESMHKLSNAGFCFKEEQYPNYLSKDWSKRVLKVFYPLFRQYDPNIPLEEQTKDYLGNNRYYKEIYKFGEREVLLTSEWYKESKKYYIEWYNGLFTTEE